MTGFSQEQPRGVGAVDPAGHLLSEAWNRQFWYDPEPAEAGVPVPLDEMVAGWRAAIQEATSSEPYPGGGVRLRSVVLSHKRAEVIAYLLRELSKRTRPGLAVGPIRSDGSLARFAKELADDLRRRAWS